MICPFFAPAQMKRRIAPFPTHHLSFLQNPYNNFPFSPNKYLDEGVLCFEVDKIKTIIKHC
jgi:hypothetical protein